jgi:periplasmic protein TonB
VWLVGSTAVQIALVALVILLSATLAQRDAEAPLVDVKLVKVAIPPAPPPPPPAPAAPKPKTPPPKVKVQPKPHSTAMIQPKEIPTELKPPDPNPPEPEDTGGVEGGVVGGVAGGVVDAPAPPPAPPPPPPPKPSGPVKFDSTMAAPVKVQAPALEYTDQALEHEVQGTMVVECTVKVDGTVTDCKVLKGLPFMDRAVIENLERAHFKPASQAGRALDVRYTFTIKLALPN